MEDWVGDENNKNKGGWNISQSEAHLYLHIFVLTKIEFKAVWSIIVAKWVKALAEWIEAASLVMPLMEWISAMTALWVQWILASVEPEFKLIKFTKIHFKPSPLLRICEHIFGTGNVNKLKYANNLFLQMKSKSNFLLCPLFLRLILEIVRMPLLRQFPVSLHYLPFVRIPPNSQNFVIIFLLCHFCQFMCPIQCLLCLFWVFMCIYCFLKVLNCYTNIN